MVEDNLKLLVVAGSSLGIYIVLRTLIFPLLKRIAKKTNTIIDDLFLEKKFLKSKVQASKSNKKRLI